MNPEQLLARDALTQGAITNISPAEQENHQLKGTRKSAQRDDKAGGFSMNKLKSLQYRFDNIASHPFGAPILLRSSAQKHYSPLI